MQKEIKIIIYHVNIVRPICNHLVGKHHSFSHRLVIGVCVMSTGVMIAKYFGHFENEIVAYLGDGVGYALHGLGLTPIVEAMIGTYEE